jgi:hypothetical protein
MKSASSLKRDPELGDDTKNQLAKLLASKSHSASNTLRTMNQMFEEASKACHFERERALIEWLQVCVTTAVEFGLDPTAAEAKIDNEKQPATSRGSKQSKPAKNPVVNDDEEEWDDEEYGYDRIGESDDDYCPTDEDDGIVPSKKQPPRKSSPPKTNGTSPPKSPPRKKKSDTDQVVPDKKKNEASFPLLKEGAGAKALQKYIMDIESVHAVSSSDILPNGYFARAFFFPSKDSFTVSNYIIYNTN